MKAHRAGHEAGGSRPLTQFPEYLTRHLWSRILRAGESEQPAIAVRGQGISNNLAIYIELADEERKESFGQSAAHHDRHRTTVPGQSIRAKVRRPIVNIRDGSTIDQIVPGSDILRILAI